MCPLFYEGAKFVQHGFIRLRAEIIEGTVNLCVEDSGPGIPEEKRAKIFSKFQESLDVLNQVSFSIYLLLWFQILATGAADVVVTYNICSRDESGYRNRSCCL